MGKPSEIRAFLLRYASKRGIEIKEHISEPGENGRAAFMCYLEYRSEDPLRTATAISYEHADNSLVMAFLNLGDPDMDFL